MKRHNRIGAIAAAVTLASVGAGSAQTWGRAATPASGVCFYEDKNFEGQYFCSASGRSTSNVPSSTNDRISSIRIFGDAEVTVFGDKNFEGPAQTFTASVSDLRRSGFNDRISSFRTDERGVGTSGSWGDRRWDDDDLDDRQRRDDRAYRRGNDGIRGDSDDSRRAYQAAEAIVRRAYRSVFERDPDPSGLRTWTRKVMENNWSQRELIDQLKRSDEYQDLNERPWR